MNKVIFDRLTCAFLKITEEIISTDLEFGVKSPEFLKEMKEILDTFYNRSAFKIDSLHKFLDLPEITSLFYDLGHRFADLSQSYGISHSKINVLSTRLANGLDDSWKAQVQNLMELGI